MDIANRPRSTYWNDNLTDLIAARGFTRMTDFVATLPTATLKHLASELGAAPIQLQWRLAIEAKAADTLQLHARNMLIRYLHEVPSGWTHSTKFEQRDGLWDVLIAWEGCMGGEYVKQLETISTALMQDSYIPEGWMPSQPDDPIIHRAFSSWL